MQHKMCLVGVGNNNKRDPEHLSIFFFFFLLIISPKTVPTTKKRNHQGEGLALWCDSAEIVFSIPNRVSSTPIGSDLMSEDDW